MGQLSCLAKQADDRPTRQSAIVRPDCNDTGPPASPSKNWPNRVSPQGHLHLRSVARRRGLHSRPKLFASGAACWTSISSTSRSLRNAEALLRLGQAHLALGHVPQSIAAFEECIEFHPLDGATFQARIDCAKAYWQQGDTAHAEQLLRFNIAGSTLKPASPEWKDSLFRTRHAAARTKQIRGSDRHAGKRRRTLSARIRQRLVAQYMIGESYRRWAQDLLDDAARLHDCQRAR